MHRYTLEQGQLLCSLYKIETDFLLNFNLDLPFKEYMLQGNNNHKYENEIVDSIRYVSKASTHTHEHVQNHDCSLQKLRQSLVCGLPIEIIK